MPSIQQSDLHVLVVDDHELTRLSLKLILEKQPNLKLIGSASNGQEAIEIVKHHQPDVVIIDWNMPVMDGLTASEHIKAINPQIQIIAHSSCEESQRQIIVKHPHIDGICRKEVPNDYLIKMVNQLGQNALSNCQAQLVTSISSNDH